MLTIDGSMGEGGGQVLRSSLAFSLLTQTPFRATNIRAGRARPGLMRQHLAAVNAATKVSDAEVSGAELRSTELVLRPKAIRGGDLALAIGGAGSTTLVFQTVLYPLLLGAGTSSTLTLEGGTHNPMAPPMPFLERAFLPLLARMGGKVDVAFERHGFSPAGGGRWTATIHPTAHLEPLELATRGAIRTRSATALLSHVSGSIGVREITTLRAGLGWAREECRVESVKGAHGPGNALVATLESEHVTEVFTAFGERGVSSEAVAGRVVREVTEYLAAGVPVGEHLADQLVVAMAVGRGGVFRTVRPTEHTRTQIALARLFLGVDTTATEESDGAWRLAVRPAPA